MESFHLKNDREMAQSPLPRSAVKIAVPPSLSSASVPSPFPSGWEWI